MYKIKFTLLFCVVVVFSSLKITAQTSPLEIAEKHIKVTKKSYQLVSEDLDYVITDQYTDKHNGVTHIYMRQQYNGILIPKANININILRHGKVLNMGNTFVPKLSEKVNSSIPLITAAAAVETIADYAELELENLSLAHASSGKDRVTTFNDGNVAQKPIKAKLVYQVIGNNESVRLAWEINLYEKSSKNWWNSRVDAMTGEILEHENWVIHCNFDHPHENGNCNNHQHHTIKERKEKTRENPNKNMASGYRTYPLLIESPSHGNRQLVTDPEDLTASPFGWHDTNAAPGAEFTITRGNNVHAYEDQAGNNGIGFSPDGGAALNFDYSLDFSNDITTDGASENRSSSITNLFYWNNIVHDVLYQYGFDEVSGNFQQNNYGNGGNGGDYVLAEAQDGSGLNNANFATPLDGGNPRMQMFLWNGGGASTTFEVNSPGSVAGIYGSQGANFGATNFNVTGNLVIAEDGSANPSEGCNAFTNAAAINGNIAVIDRGNCQFGIKCLNAQNAGAVAVIVCNNGAGTIAMGPGADGASVNIPCLMITQGDCATIRAQIPTVNVTLTGAPAPSQLDGDFDNGIIAHEYGHGVSSRLTGGPNSSCLGGNEQQGEGWSDYIGLMLTTDFASADKNTSRGIGTYAAGQPTTGNGIRTFPYSYDLAINPHTYNDIATESVPHGVGSVWCAILWDLTWDLIEAEGTGTNDIYFGSTNANRGGGQNIAFRLVMDGMKLQGCSPTFISSRDAILAADEANYGGDYKCIIWEAFARRGVGFSADAGTTSNTDQTEAFDLPPEQELLIEKTASKDVVTEGETLTYTITSRNQNCSDANGIVVEDVLPSGLTYVNGSASNGGSFATGTVSYPSASGLVANDILTYTFDVMVDNGSYVAPTNPFPINDDVESGTGVWTANPNAGANRFQISTNFPSSSSNSWFAPNPANAQDFTLTSSSLSLEGCSSLSFNHSYNFEETWDGGTIEISTDGGGTWDNLTASITQNGYPNQIAGNSGTSLQGQPAFTGNSGGYVSTTINLSEFTGQTIQIRYHVASDGNTVANGANVGWYIDDIVLTNEMGIINTATATFNGLTSSSSHCLRVEELLDIELKSISATADNNRQQIIIDWETETETNNKGFDLERSTNGKDYEKIAWIDGNGTTLSPKRYNHKDRNVSVGTTYYYRLKQVDFDESTSYTEVVSAQLKDSKSTKTDINIVPNPAKDNITLVFQEAFSTAISLEIYNTSGKLMIQESIVLNDNLRFPLDVSQLSKGIYIVKVLGNGESFNQKLIIK